MLLLSVLIIVGLLAGTAALVAGFLAPWHPALEMINHFRPFAVAGATVLVVLSLVLRSSHLAGLSALLLAAHLVLLLAPHALYAAPRSPADEPHIRVAVLNTWMRTGHADRIQHLIETYDPDIVLLQEVGQADREALLERLASSYPHMHFDRNAKFGPALVSKRPWAETGVLPTKRDEQRPLAVWARFERDGRTHVVASIHTANPFEWQNQPTDMDQLIAFVRARDEPVILGGDFNLTPFSWKLMRLARLTGLRWVQTFAASWPAHKLLPFVLLDHILIPEGVTVVQATIGPRVGSDHLPVVADLSLGPTRSGAVPDDARQPRSLRTVEGRSAGVAQMTVAPASVSSSAPP